MATLYLKRKSSAGDVVSNDNVTHPDCVLVLFYDAELTLGKVLDLKTNYFHDLASYEGGANPILYIMAKNFIFKGAAYATVLNDYIDIDLITKEVTVKDATAKTWILNQNDTDQVRIGDNWEFPV